MNTYTNKKILGIIAEYNPFHNGHEYQIKKALQLCGADYVVAVISGHFVQRGEPAIFDTSTRAEMALNCGVDAVFDMPAPFSTSSAEDFAMYGVALLEALGADFISFGCEDAGENILNDLHLISYILLGKNKCRQMFSAVLKAELASGKSYPVARNTAVLKSLTDSGYDVDTIKRISDILNKPNNILALEYIKSIIRLKAGLKPVIIKRCGMGYKSTELIPGHFASASSIRKQLFEDSYHSGCTNIYEYVPETVYKILKKHNPLNPDIITGYTYRKILELKYSHYIYQQTKTPKESFSLSQFTDISPELEKRIYSNIGFNTSYEKMISEIKSKQYTHSRISRAIIHIILDITKSDMALFKNSGYINYARLIGFKKSKSDILGIIKNKSQVPVISKAADFDKVLFNNFNKSMPLRYEAGRRLFLKEAYASQLYNSFCYELHKNILPNIFERNFLKV